MATVMKRISKVVVGLVLVVVLILVIVILALDSIVKGSINTAAPRLLGVNTHVESVSIRPFRGIVHLKNLTLANPEGYNKDKFLFSVNEFYININMASLFSDTIKIHKVLITAPGCTYEVKNGTSNIDALIAKINKGKAAEQEKQAEQQAPQQPQEKKAGKKVIIDEISLKDTKLAYSSSMTAGTFLTIPIPSITIKDIGKGKDGESFADALSEVFNKILSSFGSAIAGAGDLAGKALGEGFKGATDAVKASSDAVKSSSDALGSGVKGTTKAVGSALDEVGGLFKSKKK
jgi:hypothetical protein